MQRDRVSGVVRLGYDERFIRMWDYCLAYCEGAFLERHIGDYQLLLAKTYARRPLLGDPWRRGVSREPAGTGPQDRRTGVYSPCCFPEPCC